MKKILLVTLLLILTQATPAQWKSYGVYEGKVTYYQRVVRLEDFQTSVWIKKNGIVGNLLFDCSTPRVKYLSVLVGDKVLEETEWIPIKFKINYATWLWSKACKRF